MEFNKKIKIVFVLLFLAGMSIGFGIGARMQYDVIESFMLQKAAEHNPVMIGNEVYELVPFNNSNSTFIDLPRFDKEGAYVRKD